MQDLNQDKQAGLLAEGEHALKKLRTAKHEERETEKKNFEVLYKVFRGMLGYGNELAPDFIELQQDLVEFIQNPIYLTFYQTLDKKLTKNLLKRCVVEPFSEKLMKPNLHDEMFWMQKYESNQKVLQMLNKTLCAVTKDGLLSPHLKIVIRGPLDRYTKWSESNQQIREWFPNEITVLKQFVSHCNMIEEDVNFFNKDSLLNIFTDKKTEKASNYLRLLCSMDSKARKDDKFVSKIFGTKEGFSRFIRGNLEWFFDKQSHSFTQDEITVLISIAQSNKKLILKGLKLQEKQMLDKLLFSFLKAQSLTHPDLNLMQYDNMFQKIKNESGSKNWDFAKGLKLETFYDIILDEFAEAEKSEYREIDEKVVDIIRNKYLKDLLHERFVKRTVEYVDQKLLRCRNKFEVRNMKKLLAAIQRSKILDKVEIDALFKRADIILNRPEKKKPREEIKYQKKSYYSEKDKIQYEEEKSFSSSKSKQYEKMAPYNYPPPYQERVPASSKIQEIKPGNSSDEFMTVSEKTLTEDEEKSLNKEKESDASPSESKQELSPKSKLERESREEEGGAIESKRTRHTLDFRQQAVMDRLNKYEEFVMKVYKASLVSKEDLAKRDGVLKRISEAFYYAHPDDVHYKHMGAIQVSAFGSCQNGLWTSENSDIDMTIIFKNSIIENQHKILKFCRPILKSVAKNRVVKVVPAQKVPILKFEEKETGIQVDFNVNNILGLYNSDLIYTYAKIDQRFHIMSLFLKVWAKEVGIIGASTGLFSSYGLNLMLIAFLQQTKPPVLPCLQTRKLPTQKKHIIKIPEQQGFSKRNKGPLKSWSQLEQLYFIYTDVDVFFEKDMKIIKEHYMPKEPNNQSVAELLYEFFYFYSYQFNQRKQTISIGHEGGFVPKERVDGQTPFAMIDPFEVQVNPGRHVKGQSLEHQGIMLQFKTALDRFTKEID